LLFYPAAMRFLQCVAAESALVAPRFTRTRLGLTLLALGVTLVWLGARGLDAFTISVLAGSLAAIVAAAALAGSENERRALTTALTHPTTPLAVATGRWVALVTPAGLLAIMCTAAVGWNPAHAIAGVVAAGAVGACALALVTSAGNGAATGLFLFIALAGAVAPERLVALAHPGFVRLAAASAIELGPALWHYRDIATGDWGALAHALAWTGLGVLLASGFIARRRALA
jgi:hypothetical protein